MVAAILFGLALGLVIVGYTFKLDYMKFISGVAWVGAGIFVAYNYTWLGSAQWTFILICAFGLALPIWIHTLQTMATAKKELKIKGKPELEFEDEDDEETYQDYVRFEKERTLDKKMASIYKGNGSLRKKRQNSLWN